MTRILNAWEEQPAKSQWVFKTADLTRGMLAAAIFTLAIVYACDVALNQSMQWEELRCSTHQKTAQWKFTDSSKSKQGVGPSL